jgi:hypothetical protein
LWSDQTLATDIKGDCVKGKEYPYKSWKVLETYVEALVYRGHTDGSTSGHVETTRTFNKFASLASMAGREPAMIGYRLLVLVTWPGPSERDIQSHTGCTWD